MYPSSLNLPSLLYLLSCTKNTEGRNANNIFLNVKIRGLNPAALTSTNLKDFETVLDIFLLPLLDFLRFSLGCLCSFELFPLETLDPKVVCDSLYPPENPMFPFPLFFLLSYLL